jgi:hypothetical protein
MTSAFLAPLLIGVAFIILGLLLTTKESMAAWGLRNGRARIWISLLGEERAMKLTRYFFGPVVVLLGLFCMLAAFAPKK